MQITLKEFIESFVCPNTAIRLWYKDGTSGHKKSTYHDVEMEHQLVSGKYAEKKVIGVTDILVTDSHFVEAVNIVIEE